MERRNQNREDPLELEQPYVIIETRTNDEPKYKPDKRLIDKNKEILVHTDNIRRPRKHRITITSFCTDVGKMDS